MGRVLYSYKKMFILFFLFVTLTLIFFECVQASAPLGARVNRWPAYEAMFLSRSLRYYDEQNTHLIKFSSTAKILRAYRNGLTDVAVLTADEALLAQGVTP